MKILLYFENLQICCLRIIKNSAYDFLCPIWLIVVDGGRPENGLNLDSIRKINF